MGDTPLPPHISSQLSMQVAGNCFGYPRPALSSTPYFKVDLFDLTFTRTLGKSDGVVYCAVTLIPVVPTDLGLSLLLLKY